MTYLRKLLLTGIILAISISHAQISPDDLIVKGKQLVNEGYAEFDKEKLFEARALFERALSIDPDNQWGLYHQLYTDYRLTIFFMQNKGNDDFEKYMSIAEKEGDYLIELYPDNAEAKALMCSLYGIKISNSPMSASVLGPKSQQLIDQALKMDPDNPRILLQKGVSVYNTPEFFGGSKIEGKNFFQDAVKKFESSAKQSGIKPNWGYLDALAWLGIAHNDNGDTEKAISVFERALEVNPNFGWIKYKLLPSVSGKQNSPDVAETGRGNLRIVFKRIETDKGKIKIALNNSKENYDANGNPYQRGSAEIIEKSSEFVFADLPFGDYAVKSYHDQNNNNELDSNFFGMPTEPYGFSNNARGSFGPPDYEDVRFRFEKDGQTIEIILK